MRQNFTHGFRILEDDETKVLKHQRSRILNIM